MLGDEAVQLSDTCQRVSNPAFRQQITIGIQDAEIVVGLSPVHSNEEHQNHLQSIELELEPEVTVAT